MCMTCVDVIRQYWPDMKPDTNIGTAGTHPAAEILWNATAFPFCGPEQLDEQLARFFYRSALRLSTCSECGQPIGMPDGEVHIGAICTECETKPTAFSAGFRGLACRWVGERADG